MDLVDVTGGHNVGWQPPRSQRSRKPKLMPQFVLPLTIFMDTKILDKKMVFSSQEDHNQRLSLHPAISSVGFDPKQLVLVPCQQHPVKSASVRTSKGPEMVRMSSWSALKTMNRMSKSNRRGRE